MLLILSPGLMVNTALAIPLELKQSLDADKHKPEIAAAVTAVVADLGGNDPAKRTKAREALTGEVSANGLSGQFLDAYAQEINTQLKPLATNSDVRIRLNVAIVVARVAEKADSSRLYEITDILLNDKSDAIVNWALKAARYVLPPILQTGLAAQQKKLLDDIKAQASKPPLLSLVYEALSVNYSGIKPNAPGWNKIVQMALPEMLEVLKARIKMYQKQIPPEPAAEEKPISFLAANQVLKEVKPAQQVEIVQVLSDLLYLSAHRAAIAGAGADRDQLVLVAARAAGGLYAVASFNKDVALAADLEKLARDPASPNALQQIDQLPAKLKAIPAWGSVQSPPKLEGGSTTSSAPTTAPAK